MNNTHAISTIAVCVLVTAGLRFFPFLIFGENRKTPPVIAYLGQVLPFAIMGMLVVYCLKDVSFICAPFGIPEAIGYAVVAGLHVWKRTTLLSIGAGTVVYMLQVQFLF